MTASDEQAAAAREALALGEQTAETYWQAAAANPGVGAEVRLPSYPNPAIGRPVVGLSYDTPGEPAPAPGRPRLKLTPDYSTDVVGGALHLGTSGPGEPGNGLLDGVAWPAGQPQPSSAHGRSLVYVPATTQPTWRGRLREAWAALLGR
jgi:hypothetical protein